MPYIRQSERDKFTKDISSLADSLAKEPENNLSGNLNYCITKLIHSILAQKEKVTYDDYNSMIGMLESCKLEFYSEKVRLYEIEKKRLNGDV